MMDSRFDTIAINKIILDPAGSGRGTGPSDARAATAITAASKNPLRIVIDNISFAAEVYLALSAGVLQTNEPGTETFCLNAGRSLTMLLAPNQRIYGISLSDGAMVSVAISEALPMDTKS